MEGLGSNGFTIKRQPDIIADIEDKQKLVFGTDLELDPSSPDAQFNGLMSDQIAGLWELGLALYTGLDPRAAGGAMLDRISSIAGIVRQQPLSSTATLQMKGVVGTVVPAGSIFSSEAIPHIKFILETEAILDDLGYALGGVIADKEGAVLISSNTITKIETPIAGLSSVTNPNSGNIGRDRETDESLRRRRANSVGLASNSLITSIYSNIANVDGVARTKIYENNTATTNAMDIPAHSLSVFVEGGRDSDIAEVIANKRSLGCGLVGSTTAIYEDTNGFVHDIKFSRPTNTPVYIKITAEKLSNWDTNAHARIAAAIVGYAKGESSACNDFLGYGIGDDVYGTQLIYGLAAENTIRIQSVLVGSSAPANTQIQNITFDEIATFDEVNVEIVYV